MDLEKLKYPIGKFSCPTEISEEELKMWLNIIEKFPARLEILVADLNDEQLDTTYRPDGWTVRQVIHHCADSHLNSILRFKWALTENVPTIKPYDQDGWAKLGDSLEAPIEFSISLLKSLHAKWVYLLRKLTKEDLKKTFYNPETEKELTLETTIGIYSWHCEHHYSHIANLIKNKNWK